MPIMKCQSNKQKGLKYGETGKCYTGSNALDKALLQMRAIKYSQGGKK